MQGKDIFLALSKIDNDLIEEAENDTPHHRVPFTRWATLAACICLLIGWAAVSTVYNTAKSTGSLPETAADNAVMSEECGEAVAEDTAGADGGTAILNNYTDEFSNATGDTVPLPGAYLCASTLEAALRENTGKALSYLVTFDLFGDAQTGEISTDDPRYTAEWERLASLGYSIRALPCDGSQRLCLLLTAEEIQSFSENANAAYGYSFHFPLNQNGEPLDWNAADGAAFSPDD